MPNTPEPLQQLRAALEAQSCEHWWPVLLQLLTNSEGWYNLHTGIDQPDPAIDEAVGIIESADAHAGDKDLALALAELEIMRRRAVISPGVFWTPFDGPFSQFLDLAPDADIRTDHDTRTPADRLAYTLLGWALFPLN